MISKSIKVPEPLPIDDEYLLDDGEEGAQPGRVPSQMGMFVYSCRLFELLPEIPDHCFAEDTGNALPSLARDMVDEICSADRLLDAFANSIPDYLRAEVRTQWEISDNVRRHVRLQQQVIFCR